MTGVSAAALSAHPFLRGMSRDQVSVLALGPASRLDARAGATGVYRMGAGPDPGDQLLDMLGMALRLIGPDAVRTSVDVQAGQALSVIVTGTRPDRRSAEGNGYGPDFAPLRDRAGQAGIAIEVGSDSGGTRLAWSVPIPSGLPAVG